MSLSSRIKRLEINLFPPPSRKYKAITLYGDEEYKLKNYPDIDANTDVYIFRIVDPGWKEKHKNEFINQS